MAKRVSPLDGVTVLDFSEHFAGPSCSLYLADFGATVIKVEAPPHGEHSRSWGKARYGPDGQFSSVFVALNRNKKGIVINLKSDEGRAVAHRLAAKADVVVESFTPGVASRLGVGYEHLRTVNPRLVYCSISGYGQTGPMRERGGFDFMLQAYAGPMSVTGVPDGPSIRIGPSVIDLLTGANAAIGIMAALRARDVTGEGQLVDTSLYESTLQMMTHLIADYSGTGRLTGKFGQYFPFSAPYGMFFGSDREFFLGVANDGMWDRFAEAAGLDELRVDERFLKNRDRVVNRDQLYEILIPIFQSRTAGEWLEISAEVRVPATLVHTVDEIIEQEQALARDMIVDASAEHAPGVRAAGLPIKLSETPAQIRQPPPLLGADTRELLAFAGYSDTEAQRLFDADAVA
jgi:crotonobetainyl-CoA:carnitine CoA-transferase CaiB-like acyl-CoA transferase